jgi:ribosomal protein S18 acetylase RimI-like enzyme
MVDRLLHDPDRRDMMARFFGTSAGGQTPSNAQQVRVGAFVGETLVGWSHAFLPQKGVLYVSSSAVESAYRRQGVYTRLVAAVEEEARALGCNRVESHHRTANVAVLIAKMKAGYTIVGTEFTSEMGLLVKLAKQLDPRRDALLHARAGILEGAARFFESDEHPQSKHE